MDTSYGSAIKLLGLSDNEVTILSLLGEHNNPVFLSRNCKIPRPTIYVTLNKLEERGLIKRRKHNDKLYWEKVADKNIESNILSAHRFLSGDERSIKDKISLNKRTHIVIHKGEQEILDVFSRLIHKHAGERLISINGNHVGKAWSKVFDPENINKINKQVKKHKMISELVISDKWFTEQAKIYGKKWAKDFEGRAARYNSIDNKYLNYGSQIFIFDDQVYLVSMEEEVFIEIKNPEIAKLVVSLIRFVQDNSDVIDGNAFLRKLIEDKEIINKTN